MRRSARYWDIVANSGQFTTTLPMLWSAGAGNQPGGVLSTESASAPGDLLTTHSRSTNHSSSFASFLRISDWLHATLRRTHQIALQTVAQRLFDFLTGENHAGPATVAAALQADWKRTRGREALTLRGVTAAALRTARGQARHTRVL